MSKKNFYITTPIYYPSGNPHMGHAYSSIIADVFARFKRLEGKNVYFLTGTDEHGLKIQREAEKNSKDVKFFCDELSNKFKDLTKTLNLSNDDFIRTTEVRHHRSVQAVWNKLLESGDIYLSKYSGWYSVSDEAYYNEDEIISDNGKKISKSSGSSKSVPFGASSISSTNVSIAALPNPITACSEADKIRVVLVLGASPDSPGAVAC